MSELTRLLSLRPERAAEDLASGLQNARHAVAGVGRVRKQIQILTGQDERGVLMRVLGLTP